MKPNKYIQSTACAIGAVLAMLVGNLQAQQVPIPQTAAEVPGPTPGPMTKAYVQMAGRMAYVWGWPLVYVYNQRTELTKAPETGLLAGIMPIGPMNQVVMLTNYIDPRETFIAIPNQDVVYGLGWLSLAKEPVVLQVPDFGNRFWTFPVYDARTDEISELGLQYGTKPGFYMVVGPNWKGATPAGIAGVVRSTTEFAVAMPRIFMDDTPEDHAAIQPALSQIQVYPLSQFDGKMKTKDWSKLPHFPVPKEKTRPKYSTKQPPWVDPAVFFDQLPAVMKQVPPMPGEEALYKWIGSMLDAAAKDPEVMKTLRETAFAADQGNRRANDAVALQRPARGQRLDIGEQQRRVWHGLHPPYGRSEGLPLLQQAQRDGVLLYRQRLARAAAGGRVVVRRSPSRKDSSRRRRASGR